MKTKTDKQISRLILASHAQGTPIDKIARTFGKTDNEVKISLIQSGVQLEGGRRTDDPQAPDGGDGEQAGRG